MRAAIAWKTREELATILGMVGRASKIWLGSVGLLVVGTLAAPLAWAGPPPPPNGGEPPMRPGVRTSAPPPPSGSEGERLEAPSDPLVIDQRTPETDIGGTWKFSRAATNSEPNYVHQVEADPFFTINPIGYYQGVSLAGGNLPPFAPREVGGQSAVLTWTGFEQIEAGSRVFFQLSAAVEPKVVIQDDKVIVELPRTSVQVRNNRRKLITRYFKTPVTEVEIHRKGKTVHAVMQLRWPSEPTWSIQPGTNGYQVLVFEFPDTALGSASSASEAAQPSAEPEPSEPSPPEQPVADTTDPFLPT